MIEEIRADLMRVLKKSILVARRRPCLLGSPASHRQKYCRFSVGYAISPELSFYPNHVFSLPQIQQINTLLMATGKVVEGLIEEIFGGHEQ